MPAQIPESGPEPEPVGPPAEADEPVVDVPPVSPFTPLASQVVEGEIVADQDSADEQQADQPDDGSDQGRRRRAWWRPGE
jgi:hypothetical protein